MKTHPQIVSRNLIRLAAIGMLAISISLIDTSCTSSLKNPPPTAATVDISRYTGRWYEIARLPMPFQKADESAIAEYGLLPNGTLSVHNIATRPDGTQHDIHGYAEILNAPENTKLAVHFSTWFAPFIPIPKQGNYWILHVDEDYQQAIVGTPDRKYLWILARTPVIPDHQFQDLAKFSEKLGFDLSRLIRDPRS